MTVSITIAR